MTRRLVPAVIAVAALALVGLPGTADAGSRESCFGYEPNVVGTDGDDVITVSGYEAGVAGRVNGERFDFDPDHGVAVIRSGAGDDEIRFSGDPGYAVICSGRGDDVISGSLIGKVSAGPGNDRVSLSLVCSTLPVVYDAEQVKITGFDSVEEGPCN